MPALYLFIVFYYLILEIQFYIIIDFHQSPKLIYSRVVAPKFLIEFEFDSLQTNNNTLMSKYAPATMI
jgi:hypothetical protein